MNLTQHFTLAEMTHTELRQFDNTPPAELLPSLRRMASFMEMVRAELGGRAVNVHSCYRSKQVNDAVGSSDTSTHRLGLAVDFVCPAYGDPLAIAEKLQNSVLNFDQLILEFYRPGVGGWVHIGLGPKMRRQILTINRTGTFAGLHA